MRTQSARHIGMALAAIILMSSGADAQGNSHGKGKDKDRDEHDRIRYPTGQVLTRDRDGHIVNGRHVPPGLARKPGQMPPGQYRKLYSTNQGADALGGVLRRNGYSVTRVVPTGQSRYVYYRDHDGRERRAIVSPGTTRLSFGNVPPTLLQQVLLALP
ncbi:MAG: hypothetical protein JWM95_2805 [Gemmatimonadetes bacterium]|nr:hypothetical protein [Gemmatimonadota bacterium]